MRRQKRFPGLIVSAAAGPAGANLWDGWRGSTRLTANTPALGDNDKSSPHCKCAAATEIRPVTISPQFYLDSIQLLWGNGPLNPNQPSILLLAVVKSTGSGKPHSLFLSVPHFRSFSLYCKASTGAWLCDLARSPPSGCLGTNPLINASYLLPESLFSAHRPTLRSFSKHLPLPLAQHLTRSLSSHLYVSYCFYNTAIIITRTYGAEKEDCHHDLGG